MVQWPKFGHSTTLNNKGKGCIIRHSNDNMYRGVRKRSGGPLYDTAMIICKVVRKRSGGPLYDIAMIICKRGRKRSGGGKNGQGGAL